MTDWPVWEPGKVYRVPVVRGTWRSVTRDWVVLGPQHEDAEHLNFPYQHFHLDPRFVPKSAWRDCLSSLRGLQTLLGAPLMNSINPATAANWTPPTPLGIRRRKMLRSVPDAMIADVFGRLQPGGNFDRLRTAYAGDRLRDGVCPHRGLPLHGLEPDAQGCVTCPGHGLRWDVTTGRAATHGR